MQWTMSDDMSTTLGLWGTTWISMFVLCCLGCCGAYNTEYERTWREPPKPEKPKKEPTPKKDISNKVEAQDAEAKHIDRI